MVFDIGNSSADERSFRPRMYALGARKSGVLSFSHEPGLDIHFEDTDQSVKYG